jgi:hypothetical protein
LQQAVRDYAARSSSARRAKASSAKIAIDPLEDHTHQCATFGLLLIVLGCRGAEDAPRLVAAWIGVAYSFTASTSFTNPAITIARSLSDTFAASDRTTSGFIISQLTGVLAAYYVGRWPSSSHGKIRPVET